MKEWIYIYINKWGTVGRGWGGKWLGWSPDVLPSSRRLLGSSIGWNLVYYTLQVLILLINTINSSIWVGGGVAWMVYLTHSSPLHISFYYVIPSLPWSKKKKKLTIKHNYSDVKWVPVLNDCIYKKYKLEGEKRPYPELANYVLYVYHPVSTLPIPETWHLLAIPKPLFLTFFFLFFGLSSSKMPPDRINNGMYPL